MDISHIDHTHIFSSVGTGNHALLNKSLADSMNESAEAQKQRLSEEKQKPTSLIENMIENNRRDMQVNAEQAAKRTDLYV